jgi:predicted DCC family thiol-disulfide oxidoreductase YuxK
MKHAWTGGQYSLWRTLLGCLSGLWFARRAYLASTLPDASSTAVVIAGIETLLCVALVLGVWHRSVALLLAAAVVAWPDPILGDRSGDGYALAALLVLCACTRPAPFLSLPALGRIDPGGSWILPDWVYACGWILLAAVAARDAFPLAERALWPGGEPEIVERAWSWLGWIVYLVPLAIGRRWLPFTWLALFAFEIAIALRGNAAFEPSIEKALLFGATFDPGWIAPASERAVDTVFYDGHCGLCHRLVRFLLAEDRRGSAFRFAPLDSDRFRALVPDEERTTLPDSVIVRSADGRLLSRWSATRRVVSGLGGVWRVIAIAAGIIPASWLDRLYDLIAGVRHKLFARPADACPLMPEHLRRRFDA